MSNNKSNNKKSKSEKIDRRYKIAVLLDEVSYTSEDERLQAIRSFEKSNLTIEEIEGVTRSMRDASLRSEILSTTNELNNQRGIY